MVIGTNIIIDMKIFYSVIKGFKYGIIINIQYGPDTLKLYFQLCLVYEG